MSFEQINNTTGTVTYLHHDQQGSTRLLTMSTLGQAVATLKHRANTVDRSGMLVVARRLDSAAMLGGLSVQEGRATRWLLEVPQVFRLALELRLE